MSRVMKGSLLYQGVLVFVLQVSVQCLPLTEGGTKSAGQWRHWVLCPPCQQHSLGFAEVAKNVHSSWPFSVCRIPAGESKEVYLFSARQWQLCFLSQSQSHTDIHTWTHTQTNTKHTNKQHTHTQTTNNKNTHNRLVQEVNLQTSTTQTVCTQWDVEIHTSKQPQNRKTSKLKTKGCYAYKSMLEVNCWRTQPVSADGSTHPLTSSPP